MKLRILIASALSVTYLIIGVLSLPYYGVNWDESVHFGRGQAILYYFLTGDKDYGRLKEGSGVRRSFYKSQDYTFQFFEEKFTNNQPITVGGHPPLSGLLAAVLNTIFYEKLGILGDIESYHLYGVILSSAFVGILFLFVADNYGLFSGLVAAISLMTFPLFLGESRFNIKDVPETVYYGIAIICFYYTFVKKSTKWLVLTAIVLGLGLATKLNSVFALGTLCLWGAITSLGHRKKLLVYFLFVIGLSGAFLFMVSWPMLWADPIKRVAAVYAYYKSIGTNPSFDARYLTIFHFNTYAGQWILYTTPIVTLALSLIGLLYAKSSVSLLVLLWFIIPVARVSIPGANIYGGVRQIMEYIPALSIFSGIGAMYLLDKFKAHRVLVGMVVIVSFIPITMKMISMYPNESVYFNPIIGGLKGAAEKNIPGWGNSLGSTYRQGVRWINANAQRGAKITNLFGHRSNIALIDLRPDIEFESRFRSGIMRQGEYIIGPTHEGSQEYSYLHKYLDRFLEPVYQLEVEGVPVLKVWKNDLEHTREEYQRGEKIIEAPAYSRSERTLVVDAGNVVKFTKIDIRFSPSSCSPPSEGYIEYSIDRERWWKEGNDLAHPPIPSWFQTQPEPGAFQFLFAAEPARYIQFVILDTNSCLLKNPLQVTISYL